MSSMKIIKPWSNVLNMDGNVLGLNLGQKRIYKSQIYAPWTWERLLKCRWCNFLLQIIFKSWHPHNTCRSKDVSVTVIGMALEVIDQNLGDRICQWQEYDCEMKSEWPKLTSFLKQIVVTDFYFQLNSGHWRWRGYYVHSIFDKTLRDDLKNKVNKTLH